MTSLTIPTTTGPIAVDATAATPGLLVFEAPEFFLPESTHRWLLAHHEGHVIAAFETEEAATRAAQQIAPLADWTKSVMTSVNQISLGLEGGAQAFMRLLRELGAEEAS